MDCPCKERALQPKYRLKTMLPTGYDKNLTNMTNYYKHLVIFFEDKMLPFLLRSLNIHCVDHCCAIFPAAVCLKDQRYTCLRYFGSGFCMYQKKKALKGQ
jgi:hypothetical protein